MAKQFDFIMSDESVNSYGFRLLTNGVKLENFQKNPVCFYSHIRPDQIFGKPETLPIGRWENVRVEGMNLVGTLVLDDDNDEFAAQVAEKIENKYLNAVSVGIDPLEISEDAADMVPGQTRPTVTSWELVECSVADIPSNKNAIRLKTQGKTINLSESSDDDINNFLPKITLSMKLISNTLNLSEQSGEQEAVNAIKNLQTELANKKAEVDKVVKERDELSEKIKQAEKEKTETLATSLVDGAISQGKINKGERDSYVELAKSNYDSVKQILDNKPVPQSLNSQINNGGNGESEAYKDWGFEKLHKEAPNELSRIKEEEPDRYKKLYKSKFGKEPEL